MANTLSGFSTFSPGTVISSSDMNTNLSGLKNGPTWHKYTVAYTDINAATITNDAVLVTLTSDEIVHNVYVKHSTAFAGGSISNIAAKVGTSATTDRYTTDFDIDQTVADSAYQLTSVLLKENTTTALILTVSATGANLDSLTAGEIDVYIQKSVLPTA